MVHCVEAFIEIPRISDLQAGQQVKYAKIKCCKDIKITPPPNEWRNIPVW